MTRTSQSTVFIMARAGTTSRKSGTAGNCPQWMRTLEDKYQKLHKKIAENTGIGHHRFNHQVGRSVYDCRLSHALQKYREISAVRPQNVIANSNSGKGDKQPSDCVTNTAEPSLSAQKQNSKHAEANKLTFDDNVNICMNNEMNNERLGSQCAATRTGNDGDSDLDNSEQASTSDSESELDEALPDKSNERLESGDEAANDTKQDPDDNYDSRELKEYEQRQDVTKESVYTRNVKTSLSRTSKVTSRSCPAKIQSKSVVHSRQPTKTLLSRSKSAHKNMYIQMSEEAKHAITETIHEMNITGQTKPERKTEITFVPSRTRKTIKTWAVPRKTRTDNKYNSLKVIEGATKKLERLTDDVTPPELAAPDNTSCRSSAGSSSNRDGSAILPEIQPGSMRENSGGKNNSLRLPGIGKYEIKVDNTFEITPPGFDSRYNDMVPVEERESETPPPDIRQRAIDKCSEWLTKYSK